MGHSSFSRKFETLLDDIRAEHILKEGIMGLRSKVKNVFVPSDRSRAASDSYICY